MNQNDKAALIVLRELVGNKADVRRLAGFNGEDANMFINTDSMTIKICGDHVTNVRATILTPFNNSERVHALLSLLEAWANGEDITLKRLSLDNE